MKSGRHTSVCQACKRTLKRLKSLSIVKKIVLGASNNCRHKFAPGSIRIQQETDAGFKINLYGSNGITTGYLYCDQGDKAKVKELAEIRLRNGAE